MKKSEINNSENPLVTVIATSYNSGKYVVQLLDCIKLQTYKSIDLIIIDDLSSDNSVELIDDWIKKNNYKCQFIKHTKNIGASASCNEGLNLAKVKYICNNGDDLFEYDRFEKQVKLFNNDDSIAFVCGNSILIDENNNESGIYLPKDFTPPENIYLLLISLDKGIVICTPTNLYNAEILKQEGGYTTHYLQEDYNVLMKLARRHKIVYENNFLVRYRVRHDSLGNSKKYLIRLRKDTLEVIMDVKPDNREEKNAKKTGIITVLKSIYYHLNTDKFNEAEKNELYLVALNAIKYLKDNKLIQNLLISYLSFL